MTGIPTPEPIVAGTVTPAVVPPGTPVVQPPATPEVSAPPTISVPGSSTEIEAANEGDTPVNWQRRYDSLRGTMLEMSRMWNQWGGQVQARMEYLEGQQRQGGIANVALQTERDSLRSQLEGVPEIRTAAARVPNLEEQLAKQRFAMNYPTIIGQIKEETVEVEGQDPQTVRRNRVLDMALSSTLVGPEWETMLQDLAQTLGATPAEALTPARPLVMTPPGAPPEPVQGESIEELMAQAQEASLEGNHDEAGALYMQVAQLRDKLQS